MSIQEYKEIVRLLKGSFRFMLQTREQEEVWLTWLKNYEFADVKAGVTRYILSSAKEPTVRDIIESIEKAQEAERMRRSYDRQQRMVHCPHCRDTGLIVTESPTGILQSRPCEMCERGRENYPFYFKTDEEKEQWYRDNAAKGAVRPFEASQEFVNAYVYGVVKE